MSSTSGAASYPPVAVSRSAWLSLPSALYPLICSHLSSCCDLVCLSNAHRRLATVISSDAGAACWRSVGVVAVVQQSELTLIDGRPAIDGRAMHDAERHLWEARAPRSLRFVSRLRWEGLPSPVGSFPAALPSFRYLAHLWLHASQTGQLPGTHGFAAAVSSLSPSLVSLTLVDSLYDPLERFVPPNCLLPLRLSYLATSHTYIKSLLKLPHLPRSPLSQSLVCVHVLSQFVVATAPTTFPHFDTCRCSRCTITLSRGCRDSLCSWTPRQQPRTTSTALAIHHMERGPTPLLPSPRYQRAALFVAP